MKPQKFVDSDAAFNLGAAVGALDVCQPGVYVAMSGRVAKPEKMERNMRTGLFQSKL
eukprot:CAMPEP_0167802094 /NCGR_PEP_ID=MMETSP0111_2-20121227/18893_1 /TAXON_ID=91324 /ORGANISM="Lotharella globosa, Strain CCCM811" /LENGTH=56 /DNA_ID=CAMNT_0007698021 /DNA_START=293 /DNA_END=463 /DNA_ORIENTATION=+